MGGQVGYGNPAQAMMANPLASLLAYQQLQQMQGGYGGMGAPQVLNCGR